jgi:hypothetical protein
VPDAKTSVFEKAALTLMGLGVTYKEAAAFVLGAQEKAGNGAGAEQVAQRAYADYLAAQKPDEDADDLRQSDGYEDLLKNGTINTEGL